MFHIKATIALILSLISLDLLVLWRWIIDPHQNGAVVIAPDPKPPDKPALRLLWQPRDSGSRMELKSTAYILTLSLGVRLGVFLCPRFSCLRKSDRPATVVGK